MLEHLNPNRYELHLLNEVLYALIGQETAKISEVKAGGLKNVPTRPDSTPLMRPHLAKLADFFPPLTMDL